MKTQEIVLKDDKPLKVVMQEDAKEIDEVVVTGILTVKKTVLPELLPLSTGNS